MLYAYSMLSDNMTISDNMLSVDKMLSADHMMLSDVPPLFFLYHTSHLKY
jgi:hypothetical protein